MNKYAVAADERIYTDWLYDDDIFEILDRSRPIRRRCFKMTTSIARLCDGARALDHRGFNMIDSAVGRNLAANPHKIYELTPEQVRRWCIRLCRYRKQFNCRFLTFLFEGKA